MKTIMFLAGFGFAFILFIGGLLTMDQEIQASVPEHAPFQAAAAATVGETTNKVDVPEAEATVEVEGGNNTDDEQVVQSEFSDIPFTLGDLKKLIAENYDADKWRLFISENEAIMNVASEYWNELSETGKVIFVGLQIDVNKLKKIVVLSDDAEKNLLAEWNESMGNKINIVVH